MTELITLLRIAENANRINTLRGIENNKQPALVLFQYRGNAIGITPTIVGSTRCAVCGSAASPIVVSLFIGLGALASEQGSTAAFTSITAFRDSRYRSFHPQISSAKALYHLDHVLIIIATYGDETCTASMNSWATLTSKYLESRMRAVVILA